MKEYTLKRKPTRKAGDETRRRAIVPPKPGKGERQPRPYSPADLDALWATAHRHDWQAIVTLNPPPTARITSWPLLRGTLEKLKVTLTNWKRREAFPACIAVTELDPVQIHDGQIVANFHIGFLAPLTEDQRRKLCDYWLKLHGLPDNRGRAFQHDARGGGKRLQDYLAKDISHREGRRIYVKYPAPWLPERTECRLWFAVGVKRAPAKEGARMRSERGFRRRRFDSEHGKTFSGSLTVSTRTPDSEHAPPYITAEAPTVTVADTASNQEVKSTTESRQECRVCWHRWGRSLWAGSCRCTLAFQNG